MIGKCFINSSCWRSSDSQLRILCLTKVSCTRVAFFQALHSKLDSRILHADIESSRSSWSNVSFSLLIYSLAVKGFFRASVWCFLTLAVLVPCSRTRTLLMIIFLYASKLIKRIWSLAFKDYHWLRLYHSLKHLKTGFLEPMCNLSQLLNCPQPNITMTTPSKV